MAKKQRIKHFWTPEEVSILVKHYPYMRARNLVELLPRHTVESIYLKARQMGIKANVTNDDVAALFSIGMTNTQIADELGRSPKTIYYHKRKLQQV
jgi:DNA-binding NarL/FixJ family response regulator